MHRRANELSHAPDRRRLVAMLTASWGLLLGAATACDEPAAREPLPDWSAGYPDAGSDAGSATTPPGFALVIPDNLGWPVRLGQRDALDQPCVIAPTGMPAQLECLLDVNELDLWVLGLRYDIVVSEGMCDMLLQVPYLFDNFETGDGPERVSYTINQDGSISDEVNAMNGEPYCPYDYSRLDQALPNCCMGSYQLEVKSQLTGQVNRSRKAWGGRAGDCYYGGAFVEEGAQFDATGMPMPHFTHLEKQALREPVSYEGVSAKFPSNIALANYFDPADHAGGPPAPLLGPRAHPYYDTYCLDDAEEIVALLRLTVREWNEVTEFDMHGDPDTTGIEADRESGPRQVDDITDWKALALGAGQFPALPINR